MTNFQEDLLTWYQKNKRPLLFRQDANAYKIWISEIMAQQTRIEAMLPYFERFIEKVPDIPTLATIADEQLNKLWQGLGYYSRARNLKKCAQVCMEKYDGKLPETKEELMKLPGIGPYTAGAIASIAYDQRVSAVDGNVIRVFSRLYGMEEEIDSRTKKNIEKLVQDSLPEKEFISDYNQALMELGALICIPKNPRCISCPVKENCVAYRKGIQGNLPVLKKKKERKVEEKQFYIYVYKNKIHLKKRENKGLLANLYGFDEERVPCVKEIELKEHTHIFSHIQWNMKGTMLFVEQKTDHFYSIDEIEEKYAIPSAFVPFYTQVKQIIERELV